MSKNVKKTASFVALLVFSLLISVELCQAQWHVHSTPPFQYNRFDGVFVPGPNNMTWANKIYFMGGRTGSPIESPNIWSFDPLTGTYTDTGNTMIEDVSNYTANLIMDDGTGRGPAVYVIGGYDADNAAAAIGTVQRYYPQTGTVEALPPSDDWPGIVGGNLTIPGGTAVVNGKIYVFGGSQSVSAPYYYDGTWEFDPSKPSGSRWTNLGVTLNPARGYIQVAVVGTKIYAMGGDSSFDGLDIVPTNVAEVLDTANIASGWTALAPMPVASGEGRALGFDSTMNVAPHWWNKIYVIGGGDWPGSTTEVMEYDIATNTWNQAFPDLNQTRRNFAAVFVPLSTYNYDDGLPGMWVFGGRTISDDPPFADPEFYPMDPYSIPTMTEWGMIIFMMLAGLGAVYDIRRRRAKG